MTSGKKTQEQEQVYVSPDLEVVEIEIEQSIFAGSGVGSGESLQDFQWEDW